MNEPAIQLENDAVAIAKLNDSFELQQKAFLKDSYPSLEQRLERIQLIKDMFIRNRKKIHEAVNADFGNHPPLATDIFEIAGLIGRIDFFSKNLKNWMKPDYRKLTPILGNSTGHVMYQPKGVIGNMSPWNFPLQLACGPMVDMLAAGNRVILKPSDLTPNSAELLAEMVAENYDESLVTTAIGGIQLAEHFSTLRWDHLVYTGNAHIARKVMANCAQNLVPVTLELGGKSPAIIDEKRVTEESAGFIAATKASKRGQICINVDYCLVPETQLDQFVELMTQKFSALGDNNGAASCSSVINKRHYQRLTSLLQEAKELGAEVIQIGEDSTPEDRNMPFTLVLNPPDNSRIMKEEIFGPLLPIKTYQQLDNAIDYVNDGEKPLALYIFSDDDNTIDKILKNTRSGGVSINCCGGHVQPQLPFGGVGESGMGKHRGVEGFTEYSNPKAVMKLGTWGVEGSAFPPYSDATKQLADAAMGSTPDRIKLLGKILKSKLLNKRL